ncbi:MAG: hypothetical protein U0R44_04545 [Candidatus Micrarchaeia archaeon]
MNIISYMNKISSVGKYLLIAVLVFNLTSVVFAQSNISNALMSLCSIAKTMLGIGVMLMIILAGMIYALGQILGAETRARATVWATAMLTGAVIGVIIYILTPIIVNALVGTGGNGVTISC